MLSIDELLVVEAATKLRIFEEYSYPEKFLRVLLLT